MRLRDLKGRFVPKYERVSKKEKGICLKKANMKGFQGKEGIGPEKAKEK